ncbi:MAG: MFS transporter [Methanomassiliicoccales archaeon]|nr:MFS transporter [Methanomassiliicoccales archaeon]
MKAGYIQVLSSAGLSGAALLIPNMLRDELGANTMEIGIITASFNLALFASSYVFGRASDVHGRRLYLQGGLALTCVALFLLVFVNSKESLAVVRILVGLCAGIYPSALLAHVYEMEGRVGRFTAYGSLGFGVGTFVAGFVGIYYQIFLVSTVMLFAAYVISLRITFGTERVHKVPFFPVAIIRHNFPVYLSVMFRHTGANMIWVVYPIFLADLGASALFIGLVYGINAVGQFTFMRFIDRFRTNHLVIAGFIMSVITFPSYTLATRPEEIVPMQVSIAAAWSCLYVGSIKYLMERNDEKGTASGLLQSSLSISAIIGALVGGVTVFALGYHGAMYIATVMALAGLLVFLMGDRYLTRREKMVNGGKGSEGAWT